MRLCILIAAHAGLRRSDILRLAPIHYNAELRTIKITQHKPGTLLQIPATETLAAALEATPPNDNPAIPFVERAAGKPVTIYMFNDQWDAVRRRAKINRKLTMHDLRRTLAVSLYEVSKDLRVVEQMLGHRSLSSTAHYLEHRDPEKLRAILQQMWTPKGKEPIQ
jgi:integrase